SFFRAYQTVTRRREQQSHQATEEPWPRADEEEEQDPFDSEESFEEQFQRLVDEMQDAFEGNFGARGGRSRKQSENEIPSRKKESKTTSRLKQLYRAVVRRLHPDTQQEMTAQKMEWWHQAQAAYEASNLEHLELILSLCE